MVKKIEVTYHCEAVVRTGDYESVRFFYGEKTEVEAAEFRDARTRMIQRVNSTVERQVRELRAVLDARQEGKRRER